MRDGQLNIDFEGENWACCVSAIMVYPDAKAEQGQRFLDFVKARRRFHFDNAFKRVLHPASGVRQLPLARRRNERGFIVFTRDWMKDVYHNDRPLPGERIEELARPAFAGEQEPIDPFAGSAQGPAGEAKLTVSDLKSPQGASIPAEQIDVGYVQHRITRVTGEGSVYTIAPRLIIPRNRAPLPAGLTRTFWLTVKVPADAPPGVYRGSVRVQSERGGDVSVPLEFTVRKGTLDAVDVPAGPLGHTHRSALVCRGSRRLEPRA